MSRPARLVLGAAVVFALAMGALELGGWWWVWLAASAVVLLHRGIYLPVLGVRLDPATRYVLRENRRTRRHNQRIAQQHRRRLRDQKRAQRPRTRQAQ
jgi:uncharacterized membrane protein